VIWPDRLQRLLLLIGSTVAAALLLKFAVDFTATMSGLLAVPFWGLVLASAGICFVNLFDARTAPCAVLGYQRSGVTAALLVSIPVGFLTSSLDCTGLTAAGCSPFCTFVKIIWIPVLGLLSLACVVSRSRLLLLTITAAVFVPLAPHCTCYNVGNSWWIDRLGASPVCYVWGFVASLISISALIAGRRYWLSLLICGAILGGATAFFIGHHYFRFPW
jgi:hypothetical protein